MDPCVLCFLCIVLLQLVYRSSAQCVCLVCSGSCNEAARPDLGCCAIKKSYRNAFTHQEKQLNRITSDETFTFRPM